MKEVKVDDISLSNESSFTLIAGLNVLEDKGIVNEVTEELKRLTKELGIPFIFKASYDKANRSSINDSTFSIVPASSAVFHKILTAIVDRPQIHV